MSARSGAWATKAAASWLVNETACKRLLPSFSQSSPSVVLTPFRKTPLIQESTVSLSPEAACPE